MKLINELHIRIHDANCKGAEWKNLNLATKTHISILCKLIDERLPARNTESIHAQDSSILGDEETFNNGKGW